jgi:5-methylthioribose kinase
VQIALTEANAVAYLRERGLLPPGVTARVEAAGDGNINWVRRVRAADGRSWILKQARPALERFPEYRVSTERIVFEARYYEVAAPWDGGGVCPRVLHFDEAQRVLVLEDLGVAERLDAALARGADVAPALAALAAFLGRVHAASRGLALAPRFANDAMRRLHGDHVFQLPYRPNDFPLAPPLRARAEAIWADRALVATLDAAYTRYLEPRGALVHADVQAGNVLLAPGGPKLLDAEIAHVGDPAFDVGTLTAHVLLAALARGEGPEAPLEALWGAYADAHGARGRVPFADAARYAGIEVLRRTLGAARVAAVEREATAQRAVDLGLRLVTRPPGEPGGLALS